jgi:hypothetical protein
MVPSSTAPTNLWNPALRLLLKHVADRSDEVLGYGGGELGAANHATVVGALLDPECRPTRPVLVRDVRHSAIDPLKA